jgi:hypothetical protein
VKHDPQAIDAAIERVRASEGDDELDLDDFTLIPACLIPGAIGSLAIEVSRWDGKFDLELVAIRTFIPRGAIFLNLAWIGSYPDIDEDRVYVGVVDPPANAIDMADFGAASALRSLQLDGRIQPRLGRHLTMDFDVRKIVDIDMVLVFDRYPVTPLPKVVIR